MKELYVNVFYGTNEQTPSQYKVSAGTYQHAITLLIQSGLNSGVMYGLEGEIFDYQAPITVSEVNYIIPEHCHRHARLIKGDRSQIVSYSLGSTLQDLFNLVIAHDFGSSIGLALDLETLPPSTTQLKEIPLFAQAQPDTIVDVQVVDFDSAPNIKEPVSPLNPNLDTEIKKPVVHNKYNRGFHMYPNLDFDGDEEIPHRGHIKTYTGVDRYNIGPICDFSDPIDFFMLGRNMGLPIFRRDTNMPELELIDDTEKGISPTFQRHFARVLMRLAPIIEPLEIKKAFILHREATFERLNETQAIGRIWRDILPREKTEAELKLELKMQRKKDQYMHRQRARQYTHQMKQPKFQPRLSRQVHRQIQPRR
jgi:hypothetical protein